ncbi:hypothetical protein NPIL_664001 [Nephila pilipes]|uniref:Uncharacterized protein n=1 Tax=Nephila pilipes TaxID=299642 RepID=A0A8X6NVU4_NEPPI|nr:hypothetical protein NPIL_664001 [Nephila pilipes]
MRRFRLLEKSEYFKLKLRLRSFKNSKYFILRSFQKESKKDSKNETLRQEGEEKTIQALGCTSKRRSVERTGREFLVRTDIRINKIQERVKETYFMSNSIARFCSKFVYPDFT